VDATARIRHHPTKRSVETAVNNDPRLREVKIMNGPPLLPRILLTLMVTAIACADATAPEARLTAAEVAAIAAQLDLLGSDAVDDRTSGAPAGDGAMGDVAITLDVTVPCPLGGTLHLAGTHELALDMEARQLSAYTEAAATSVGCGIEAESGGVFVDGVLAYGAEHDLLWEPVHYTGLRHHQGELDWRRETGESGVCVVDITVTAEYQTDGAQATGSRQVVGTFCNHAVDRTLQWSWAGD
jgi:hypothetical protein